MPKRPISFSQNTKPWNGRRTPFGRMSYEDWEEKYGEGSLKTDHFTTEDDRRAALQSPNRPRAVPGPYDDFMRGMAVKKWRDALNEGIMLNTTANYVLSSSVPVKNIRPAMQKHFDRFVNRARAAGYEVKEIKKDPVTKVWYAEICRDDICTNQIIMGPTLGMSGGTRRKRGRRGTRRLKN